MKRHAWLLTPPLTPLIGPLLALCCAGAGAQAPDAAVEPTPPREGQRVDDRRPDQPLTLDAFGRPLQITGSWEYSDERRREFDLDKASARDRRVREHEIKLEARTRPGNHSEVFVQAVALHETRRTQGSDGAAREKALERGQTWVRFERLGGTPWTLQLGRVALIDRRAFWWDIDRDALRLQYQGESARLDTGLARELLRVSSAEPGIAADARGVTRWFGQARWRTAPRHAIDAFWLFARDRSRRPLAGSVVAHEDDADASDLDARWLGLRASGEWRAEKGPRLAYWADGALVRGREALTAYSEVDTGGLTAGATTQRRVRGQAFDLGATLALPWRLRPSLSLGYARGSGGERSAVRDANFRQTGLQENKARLAGVKRLRLYGELLQPELSNLSISKLGLGVRLLHNSSAELVALRYRQPVPSTVIVGSRLGSAPLGLSGDIGREFDLALALREWRQLEFMLKWSRFEPGAAFAADRRGPAHAVEVSAALNF